MNAVAGIAQKCKVLLALLVQSYFSLLALGNVGVCTDHPQWISISITTDQLPPGQYPFPRAIFAAHAELIDIERLFTCELFLDGGYHTILVIGMQMFYPSSPGIRKFMLGIAEHFFPALGKQGFIGLGVPIPHSISCAFQCEFPALFALAKLPD